MCLATSRNARPRQMRAACLARQPVWPTDARRGRAGAIVTMPVAGGTIPP